MSIVGIALWIGVGAGVAFVLLAVQVYLRRPTRKPLDVTWGWFTPMTIRRVCTRCGRCGRLAEAADLADAFAGRELPPHLCKRCVKEIQGKTRGGGSPGPGQVTKVAEGRDPA